MSPRAVLIGLPAVGKTSVGKAAAELLAVDFADTDDLVLEMSGRAPGQIILDDGEAAFRDVEAAVIADALLDFGGVLSLGGGAVTTPTVRSALTDSGVPIVWLTAGHDELVRRIGTTTHRPLLAGDTSERLAELAQERTPIYSELATVIIDTDSASVDEVAADLVEALASGGNASGDEA